MSNATNEEMKELEKTTVHNLAEERSVGSTNNELKVRGKRHLESVSRKLVLNKSFDLIEIKDPKDFNKFRKPAQEISALKGEWKEKMKAMEEEAFSDKETINLHIESIEYKDLEFLKSVGGPFTTTEEMQSYEKEIEDSKRKNKRLYVEVRCAKNMSLRLKHTDPVFRLKRDNKNLHSSVYAENLMIYLRTVRKSGNILSMNDLSDAIKKITGTNVNVQEKSSAEAW